MDGFDMSAFTMPTINCGTTVIPECTGIMNDANGDPIMDPNTGMPVYRYDWEDEFTYILMVNRAVDLAGLGFKVAVTMLGTSLSENLKKALNALRCMVNALGNNTWTLVAAAYYGAKFFGYDDMLVTYLNMGAELICTCSGDEAGLTNWLRGLNMYPAEHVVNEFFGACSEGAAALIEDAVEEPASS